MGVTEPAQKRQNVKACGTPVIDDMGCMKKKGGGDGPGARKRNKMKPSPTLAEKINRSCKVHKGGKVPKQHVRIKARKIGRTNKQKRRKYEKMRDTGGSTIQERKKGQKQKKGKGGGTVGVVRF